MTRLFTRIAPAALAALVATPVLAAAPAVAPAPAPAPGIIALPMQPVVGADLRACTAKTASGLGYRELRAGTGPKPGKTDFVLISYIGYLSANGQVFDQNRETPLGLEQVIPGFAEGLQMMPRGSIYRLCVPAALGYGAAGAGDQVPANADLVFQIELIDSKTTAEIQAMQSAAAARANPAQAPAAAPAQH